MKVILANYKNQELADAWKHYFEFESDVEVVDGDILSMEWDALVAPGNSFGFMDGGIDLLISKKYGWSIQTELKKRINDSDIKELLVGQAELLPIPDSSKHILYSPTMRVPTSHLVSESVNAYLAMKTALTVAVKHNIKVLAISGLCTGTGGMKPEVSAKQMFEAYDEIINKNKKDFPMHMDASKHHFYLNNKTQNL
mgnify:CR=1 FL=1